MAVNKLEGDQHSQIPSTFWKQDIDEQLCQLRALQVSSYLFLRSVLDWKT